MPLLFSLGQHRAMVAVQAQLKEGERLFAFLDDIYVVCSPDRIGQIYLLLEEQLRVKTGISIHQGKDKIVECSRVQADHGRHVDSCSQTKIARSSGLEG